MRQTFLKVAGAGLAASALGSPVLSYARVPGANDRVRVGQVGAFDRAHSALIPAFQVHAKDLNFETAADSDIWSKRREEGAACIQQLTGEWDTMTAVFDYGPLDDPSKGFQVVDSSRQTNSAGDVKELTAPAAELWTSTKTSSQGRAAWKKTTPKPWE